MIIIPFLVVVILFTFLIEFMYGIFHFNYNVRPIEWSNVYQYAVLVKYNYTLYKKSNDDKYKNEIIKYFNEINKYMDVYDARTIFGINLIDIQKEIMLSNYKREYEI